MFMYDYVIYSKVILSTNKTNLNLNKNWQKKNKLHKKEFTLIM